ncbi:hypothetical protein AVEN_27845-1 [Araneus ventricosus]|uniref:Uncharacterized protein n=1 Tax=Araneus ventricosus TaxID=182803 RepID=A0A4Y2M713_ARAVE|nr:hypothetical protein AVEN_27845-1 [Araneus ventricosus]
MYTGHLTMNSKIGIVTNMESRFPAMLVLRLGSEFYKVKHGVTGSGCSGIPDLGDELGDHFGDLATNDDSRKCNPFLDISIRKENTLEYTRKLHVTSRPVGYSI